LAVKIFISYRREDSSGHAGRIRDQLVREFGRDLLFMDVDNIPLGKNFIRILREAVASCDVLLPIIGPNWLSARDEANNRRLDDRKDFVRIEIATALQRKINVIPILLDNAKFPKAEQLPKDLKRLVQYNGLYVRHATFDSDMRKLIDGLKDLDLPFPWTAECHQRYDVLGIVELGEFVVVLTPPRVVGSTVVKKGLATRKRD
jgi:hypothetical protein